VSRGTGGRPRANGTRRSRTKKLIVAFHFQFANQAGWECDACRKAGLEKKRRCGYLIGLPQSNNGSPVWARKRVAVETCPRSYVSAESHALVEEFLVLRRLGGLQATELSAKQVEAFAILESEFVREKNDAERESRSFI
jgi:hypothetical protein